MAGFFDEMVVTAVCTYCRHRIKETVGGLKRVPKFPCPKCNGPLDVTKALRRFEEAERNIDRAMRELG